VTNYRSSKVHNGTTAKKGSMSESLPSALKSEIADTLRPVSPLASPARRAAVFLLVGAGFLVLVPAVWGLRRNAAAVGPLLGLTWVVQTVTAVLIFAAAIAESVPGRLLSPARLWTLVSVSIAVTAASLVAFFFEAPVDVPSWLTMRFLRVCLSRGYLLGLLPLVVAGVLLARGLTRRPVIAGALAGLGAGLLVDSTWRLYCGVTHPAHTLLSHVGAIGLLASTGALGGVIRKLLRR
jgi:hypothetical protein